MGCGLTHGYLPLTLWLIFADLGSFASHLLLARANSRSSADDMCYLNANLSSLTPDIVLAIS